MLIFKPKNKIIKNDLLDRCINSSFDRYGLGFVEDGKFVIKNRFTNAENFKSEVQKIPSSNSVLISMTEKDFPSKLESRGACGPYLLDDNHLIAHCGDVWNNSTEDSQSFRFFKLIKNIWNPNFFQKFHLTWLLEESLPAENRVFITNLDGELHIFNKNKCCDFDGVWFSKSPYTLYQKHTYPTSKNTWLGKQPPTNIIEYRNFCATCLNAFSHTIRHKGDEYCVSCYNNLVGNKINNTLNRTKDSTLDLLRKLNPYDLV